MFPIVWVNNIQIEIYLSTAEAEYISIGQSMRYLVPSRQIKLDVSSLIEVQFDSCNSYTTTFDDSIGAIELTEEPQYKPRTKHIFCKMSSF